MKKKIESEGLWSQHISRHGATKVTLFTLVYIQEVLPVEVNLNANRLPEQNNLSVVTYHELMMINVDEVTHNKSVKVLKDIERDKTHVERAY